MLSLAVAASFVPMAAYAACTTGGSFTSNASGTQGWGANDCSIASGVSISGGTPALDANASVGTLTNNGVIRGGEIGLRISSTYTAMSVNNNGTISANSSYGLKNQGTIGTLTNVGLISASYAGLFNDNASVITSLNNTATGTITANSFGINNSSNATISTLTNAGNVNGNVTGIYNGNLSTIVSLQNSGTISGTTSGINNDTGGSIISLNNASTGTIAGSIGIYNLNAISTLTNSGTVNGTIYGIQTDNGSRITSLTNTSTGTISGGDGLPGRQPQSLRYHQRGCAEQCGAYLGNHQCRRRHKS